jgi:hypothetical protein
VGRRRLGARPLLSKAQLRRDDQGGALRRHVRAVGCHTELVTEAAQIRPALERAFRSGKPALLNVIGEQQSVHPFRMRCNVIDTWSGDNFDELPEAAKAEMRALPKSEFVRASKRFRDNVFGTAVPIEELMRMVGRDAGY